MGAIITRARLNRGSRKKKPGEDKCPFGCEEQDTEEHRFWHCHGVAQIRQKALGDKHEWCCGHCQELQEAARMCLLPALDGMQLEEQREWKAVWPQVMNMGCDVTAAFSDD